jgi:hypothetical protein
VLRGDVLCQRAKVGVAARIEVARPFTDPVGDVVAIPGPPKIVNEVGYRFPAA